jgi:hypothetical protein
MGVFVAYGYPARDAWIGDLVFDLIRACDALIGFTTMRAETAGESGGTHPWVIEELLTAEQKGPLLSRSVKSA